MHRNAGVDPRFRVMDALLAARSVICPGVGLWDEFALTKGASFRARFRHQQRWLQSSVVARRKWWASLSVRGERATTGLRLTGCPQRRARGGTPRVRWVSEGSPLARRTGCPHARAHMKVANPRMSPGGIILIAAVTERDHPVLEYSNSTRDCQRLRR